MKLYQIVASVTKVNSEQWHTRIDLPTFYLRDDMQGITNKEHAEQIARHMVKDLAPDAVGVYITVAVSADFDPALIGA